jgi:hypothetical protein
MVQYIKEVFMNITLRFTQPIFITGQVQNTADHIIPCDDVATNANGQPVANDANWNSIVSLLNGSGVGATYPIMNSGSYERIA